MGSTKRLMAALAALAMVSALMGCGPGATSHGETSPLQPIGSADLEIQPLVTAPQNSKFPPVLFEGMGAETSPTRETSDEVVEAFGAGFVAEPAGSSNYFPIASPQSYAVVPGAGSNLSWARYAIADLTADRPVRLNVSVSDARNGEGGDAMPLYYFVAVANYTRYGWDWWGPFTGDAQVSLNHAADEFLVALTERYVSATGVLQVMVATGPATGGGDCAVQVDALAVTTSPSYLWNKPHYVWFESARAGSSLAREPKSVSALKPEQFITLAWNHVEAFGIQDVLNAPIFYHISRQGPNDESQVAVGEVYFPSTTFNDPLDRGAGVAEPTAGTTYTYHISASNSAGMTIPATTSITVPVLPPVNMVASLDGENTGFTLVSWDAADGAIGYEIWRGISVLATSSQLVGTALSGESSYEDSSAQPGQLYWYFVRSVGLGDGDEANGFEAGSVSGYSLGAQGMRKIEILVSGIEPTVGGSGTQADPFTLTSGIRYQFQSFDQVGNQLTVVCVWETDPGSAGTFDAVFAGQLDSIQPAPNDFLAQATFSFNPYLWVGNVYCTVE